MRSEYDAAKRVSVYHLSAGESVSEGIIAAVSDVTDHAPIPNANGHDAEGAMEPLYHAIDPDALDALSERLGEQDSVDQVQLDVQWVRRLDAMLDVGERLVSALALALALGVMLVLMNTIRLAIESRREEITVVKIVGGTDGFVRRPFLYTGFWYGAAGGLMAAILVQIALWWLSQSLLTGTLSRQTRFASRSVPGRPQSYHSSTSKVPSWRLSSIITWGGSVNWYSLPAPRMPFEMR